MAWALWGILNRHDRPVDTMGGNTLFLPSKPVRDICFDYGEGIEMSERVLYIESLMHPILSEIRKTNDDNTEME